MELREFRPSDLSAIIDLTVEAFRPLYEQHWPTLISPAVFAHDHGEWRAQYRQEVPALHDPDKRRFVTVAEENGSILGYVGWDVRDGDSGRLEMVAYTQTFNAAESVSRCVGRRSMDFGNER